MLGFFLEHEPEADTVRYLAFTLCPEEVAQEGVGIGFAFHETAPGHHGIGVVPAAVAVLHGIFHQGGKIRLQGLLQAGFGAQGNAPGRCQRRPALFLQEITQGHEPTALGKDLPLQAAAVLLERHQVVLGPLLEGLPALFTRGRYRLLLKGNSRIEGTDMEILGIGDATPPIGDIFCKLALIQEFNRRGNVRNGEAAIPQLGKALQQQGRHCRRGTHALEPGKTSVGIAAGEDLLQECLRSGAGNAVIPGLIGDLEAGGQVTNVPGLAEGYHVLAGRLHVRRDGIPDHVQDGNLPKGGLRGRDIHKAAS